VPVLRTTSPFGGRVGGLVLGPRVSGSGWVGTCRLSRTRRDPRTDSVGDTGQRGTAATGALLGLRS
jgi:hypothetical protein